MDRRLRPVFYWVALDATGFVFNGYLAWTHRDGGALLYINCLGLAVTAWSAWMTIDYVLAVRRSMKMEKAWMNLKRWQRDKHRS